MTPFSKAPALVQIVLVLLVGEALVLAAVFFTLLFELFSGQFQSIYAEVFLLVLRQLPLSGFCTLLEDYSIKNAGQEALHFSGNYFKQL